MTGLYTGHLGLSRGAPPLGRRAGAQGGVSPPVRCLFRFLGLGFLMGNFQLGVSKWRPILPATSLHRNTPHMTLLVGCKAFFCWFMFCSGTGDGGGER